MAAPCRCKIINDGKKYTTYAELAEGLGLSSTWIYGFGDKIDFTGVECNVLAAGKPEGIDCVAAQPDGYDGKFFIISTNGIQMLSSPVSLPSLGRCKIIDDGKKYTTYAELAEGLGLSSAWVSKFGDGIDLTGVECNVLATGKPKGIDCVAAQPDGYGGKFVIFRSNGIEMLSSPASLPSLGRCKIIDDGKKYTTYAELAEGLGLSSAWVSKFGDGIDLTGVECNVLATGKPKGIDCVAAQPDGYGGKFVIFRSNGIQMLSSPASLPSLGRCKIIDDGKKYTTYAELAEGLGLSTTWISGFGDKIDFTGVECNVLAAGKPKGIDCVAAQPDGYGGKFVIFSTNGIQMLTEVKCITPKELAKAKKGPVDTPKELAKVVDEAQEVKPVETPKEFAKVVGEAKGTDVVTDKIISSKPGRWMTQAEPYISILPYTPWEEIVPKRSLCEELRQNAGIRTAVNRIDRIVRDIESKLQELKFDDEARDLLDAMNSNEVGAILSYTHDLLLPGGTKDGNLYYEWNQAIKERSAGARVAMMETWGVLTHYALSGLSKLPSFEGVGYRGLPDRAPILKEYKMGRPIQWGSFTSVATGDSALETAKEFSDQSSGIIIKITVVSGKILGVFSFFPREGEVVLSPMSKFLVVSAPYEKDGFMFIDLFQQDGDGFYF